MYARSFSDSRHTLRGFETQNQGETTKSHRNDDVRTIAIFCDDLQPFDGVHIPYYVVQNLRSVFFDPKDDLSLSKGSDDVKISIPW